MAGSPPPKKKKKRKKIPPQQELLKETKIVLARPLIVLLFKCRYHLREVSIGPSDVRLRE